MINGAIDGGADPRQYGQQVIEHLRQMLLVKMSGDTLVDVTEERRAVLHEQAGAIGRKALMGAIRAFNQATQEWRGGWQPQLPLELAFLESIKPVAEDELVYAPRPTKKRPAPRTQHDLPPPVEDTEPEAAPEPEPQPEPGPVAAVSVTQVAQAWPQIQKAARAYHPSLPALLDHIKPRDVRGDTLVLGARSDIFKQKIEDASKRAALEDALAEVLGVSLHFTVIVVDEPQDSNPQTSDLIAHDDVLAFGVNELGGEITDFDE